MPDKQQIVLSEAQVATIEARLERSLSALTFGEPTRGNRYVESVDGDFYFEESADNEFDAFDLLRQFPALCQTVRALMNLAYIPKVLPDDETITYRDQAERLLREKVANADQIRAALDALGKDAVHVREDGGPEDIYASLAVSVARLQSRLAQVEQERDSLREGGRTGRGIIRGWQKHIERMAKILKCEPMDVPVEQAAQRLVGFRSRAIALCRDKAAEWDRGYQSLAQEDPLRNHLHAKAVAASELADELTRLTHLDHKGE